MIIRVDPNSEPLKKGESWWIVHPNDGYTEFVVPSNSISFCRETFGVFKKGITYSVVGDKSESGWITLATKSDIVEMPYYVFARYFDAEAFVRNTPIKEYIQSKQLELFEG